MANEDIQTRLAFMGLDTTQRATVAAMQPMVEQTIGDALDRFYKVAMQTPETRRFFADDAQMQRARASQMRHWVRIASGRFDGEFTASVRRIGLVHARIGLDPRWYIGAYGLVLEGLIQRIGSENGWLARARRGFRGPRATDATVAIVKAALIDMDLSISTYFEVAEDERNQAISSLTRAFTQLAAGDLVSTLSDMPAAFLPLQHSFNETVARMRDSMGAVSSSAEAIRTGSAEIAQASEDLARRTESNAASLEETSAAIVQIEGRLKAANEASATSVRRADQAIATVETGRATADEAMQAMSRVGSSAKGIDTVIEGLDKIAFQTRVLAMNAAVEAGRAGDAGRGFAVVADLVSALAMRAEEEAKRAREQLTVTQSEIYTAVQAVQNVDTALGDIAGGVDAVHTLLAGMARDNEAQAAAITEIAAAVGSMDRSTQQNAAMVEETSAAARNLANEVGTLTSHAGRFRTGQAHDQWAIAAE